MRSIASSILVVLGCAALAAANCNPSYDVAAPGPCVKECKIKAGQDMWPQWTDDPASPDFIESLGYKCERGTPAYTTYMTQSGMCVMNCSAEEQADYGNREHADSCAWYQEHKDDTCAEASASPSSSAGASESASASGDNAGAAETSPSSNDDANNNDDSTTNDNTANDAAGEQSQDADQDESAATKLQLGGLVAAVAVAGSAVLL